MHITNVASCIAAPTARMTSGRVYGTTAASAATSISALTVTRQSSTSTRSHRSRYSSSSTVCTIYPLSQIQVRRAGDSCSQRDRSLPRMTCRTVTPASPHHSSHRQLHPASIPFILQVGATKEQSAQDAAARRDRARSIQLHMQLLLHASGCVNPACPSANCSKIKVCVFNPNLTVLTVHACPLPPRYC
jgi:hypothetical protein